MGKRQKSTGEFLQQLEKDILSGKTLPSPKREKELQRNYAAGRAALYRATADSCVLPTDNSLEKKKFT